jgi:NADH-quinone oxidoreductase subunit M
MEKTELLPLSLLILLPLLFAVGVAILPKAWARLTASLGAAIAFLFSLHLLATAGREPGFPRQEGAIANWLPQIGVGFHLGVDSVSGLLVALSIFIGLFVIAYPYKNVAVLENPKPYYGLTLVMLAATIGAFCAMDLVLFYFFFEASLIPVYFLVGIYGGVHRTRAAMKFFGFSVFGALLMLASIIAIYVNTGSFDLLTVREKLRGLDNNLLTLIFAGFFVAFAVKTPLFPFHSWSPDTYGNCPTPVVAFLSGALAKLGTYGFYRFGLWLLPEGAQTLGPAICVLAAISIVYGALVAARQRDVKRTLAYSSLSHLGFVVLGLFALNNGGVITEVGVYGAILQMFNHGITTAALFFIATMLEERRGSLHLRSFGGLWEQMPLFGRVFLIVTLSSVALPLTNSFVGEFMILNGAFQNMPWAGAIAVTGVIFSAVYMLWLFQRLMYGKPETAEVKKMHDMTPAEAFVLFPFVALIFLIGLAPTPILERFQYTVEESLIYFKGDGTQMSGKPIAPSTAELPTSQGTSIAP